MKVTLTLIGIVAIAALVLYIRSRIPGYRGAIGFKNQSTFNLDYIQLVGFSRPIECRSLYPTEHSFNYRGRQDIPPTVTLKWQLADSSEIQTATVSLATIPGTLPDGEVFFVYRNPSAWAVEYADHLQLDRLRNGQ